MNNWIQNERYTGPARRSSDMNIVPLSSTEPACLGAVCSVADRCMRYAASEGNPLHRIYTCDDGHRGERPLFVADPMEMAKAT